MIRLRSALVLTATALVIAACGGNDAPKSGSDDAAPASTTSTSDAVDGKSLFVAGCGDCHTLADSGTSGTAGPNLDDRAPDAAKVSSQIASGGGRMPPGIYAGAEAEAVAAYVASAAS